MPDGDPVVDLDNDFPDHQTNQLLSFENVQCLGRPTHPFHKAIQGVLQSFRSFGGQCLPTGAFEFLGRRGLLPSELRHPIPELRQRQQSFLIGIQYFIDLMADSLEFLRQLLATHLRRIPA